MSTPCILEEKISIEAIKTDACYFIRLKKKEGYSSYDFTYGDSGLGIYYFDGKKAESTHNKNWLKLQKIPSLVEKQISQSPINHRYELIDKTLQSSKFPLIFEREMVAFYDKEENYGNWRWKDEYSQLKSLYQEKSDPRPDLMVKLDFEIFVILEIDQIKEHGGFAYPVQRTRWSHEGFVSLTDKEVQHDLVDTIIFPDIVLPARKSELTSEQSYKIIRKHTQDNINPKHAVITSDYNFCFTVCKKIPLAKKEPYQKDISRYGARKPKYVTDYRVDRKIQVFEMTFSPENYKGYTPIPGFKGKNVEELKQNIDDYLRELMEKINEPISDCPHCLGHGVIINKL
jgi:hypothetical protein